MDDIPRDLDSLEYLFPEYNVAKERERKILMSMQNEIKIIGRLNNNLTVNEPSVTLKKKISLKKRSIPLFRYIPSRLIMQRIIMRATLLPEYFTEFEPDYWQVFASNWLQIFNQKTTISTFTLP